MTVDGDQFVAVGSTANGPAAWTSVDGVTWEQHAVPQPSFLDEYRGNFPGADPAQFLFMVGMGPLARLGDTLFSFGTFAGAIDFVRPLGWRSADGTEWEYIESENPFFLQCCSLIDLVTGDPGLVAVKHNFPMWSGETWLWTAETSWVETTPTNNAYGTSGADILDAAWGDGTFVAVGVATELDPAISADLWPTWASSWVSTDGRSWQAAPASEALDRSTMYAVSPLPHGGFVAVGCAECAAWTSGIGTPAAWTSTDGLQWSKTTLPATSQGGALRVAPLGRDLLAIGAAEGGMQVWTSIDGLIWHAAPTVEGVAGRLPGTIFPATMPMAVRGNDVVVFLPRLESDRLLETVLLKGVVQP